MGGPVLPPQTPAEWHHVQQVNSSCPLGLELWDSWGHPFCDCFLNCQVRTSWGLGETGVLQS